MNITQFNYKDKKGLVHEVKILDKHPSLFGFYHCFSVTSMQKLLLYYKDITVTNFGATTGVSVASLDQVAVIATGGKTLWREWRLDGPRFGALIELKHQNGRLHLTHVHSGAECDTLMRMGYSEWRYTS